MIYLFNHYRVLKYVLFIHNKLHFYPTSSVSIPLSEINIIFLSDRNLIKHLAILTKMGYLEETMINQDQMFIGTDEGWKYYHELKLKLTNIIFQCLWAIILILIGYVIGSSSL